MSLFLFIFVFSSLLLLLLLLKVPEGSGADIEVFWWRSFPGRAVKYEKAQKNCQAVGEITSVYFVNLSQHCLNKTMLNKTPLWPVSPDTISRSTNRVVVIHGSETGALVATWYSGGSCQSGLALCWSYLELIGFCPTALWRLWFRALRLRNKLARWGSVAWTPTIDVAWTWTRKLMSCPRLP